MVACYRLYAANRIELAEHVCDLERKVFLLHLARNWLKMAEHAERAEVADNSREFSHSDPQLALPTDRSPNPK